MLWLKGRPKGARCSVRAHVEAESPPFLRARLGIARALAETVARHRREINSGAQNTLGRGA